MKADEIRTLGIGTQVSSLELFQVLLREHTAQLAELNDNIREFFGSPVVDSPLTKVRP